MMTQSGGGHCWHTWHLLTGTYYCTTHCTLHCTTPLYSLGTIIWFIMMEHHMNYMNCLCVLSTEPEPLELFTGVISFQWTATNYDSAASSRAMCNKLSDILSVKLGNWTVPIICWVGGMWLGVFGSIMLSNSSLTFDEFDDLDIIWIIFYFNKF